MTVKRRVTRRRPVPGAAGQVAPRRRPPVAGARGEAAGVRARARLRRAATGHRDISWCRRPRRPAGRRRRVLPWRVGRRRLVPRRRGESTAPGAAAARRVVTPGAAGAAVARRRAAASATGDTAARRALVAEAAARRRAASGHVADPTRRIRRRRSAALGRDVPGQSGPVRPRPRIGRRRPRRHPTPRHTATRSGRRRPVRRQRRTTAADDVRGRPALLGARRACRARGDVRVVRRRGPQRHAVIRTEVAWNRATSIVSTWCEPRTSWRSR